MCEEGIYMIEQAEVTAQEALAALHQARRTLREAREKQHQVKMSRQYYRVDANVKNRAAGLKCFKCGGPHKIAQCPERQNADKKKEQSHVSQEEEAQMAPFVCFTDPPEKVFQATGMGEQISTQQAIDQGYGIVDGGATKTIGSVYAMEKIMEENMRKHQDGRILEVDTTDKPVFGFGNSTQDQCMSTAQLRIMAESQPGTLKVHTLDRGQGPLLLSISTLRALKAVIDFDEDLIVFRGLNDKKIIQATRSAAGHQLLRMTEDLYSGAFDCDQRVPSLREFCK